MRSLVLLLLLAVPAGEAEPPLRLIPQDRGFSLFSVAPGLRAYHVAVRRALLGQTSDGCCEALVLPSFEREWAVQVRRTGPSTHELVYSVMQEQFWGRVQQDAESSPGPDWQANQVAAIRRTSADVSSSSRPIAESTVRLLGCVWERSLQQARKPEQPRRTIDGVSYTLFQRLDGTYRGGFVTSPPAGSDLAALAELVQAMRRHSGYTGTALFESDTRLASAALKLCQRLQNSP